MTIILFFGTHWISVLLNLHEVTTSDQLLKKKGGGGGWRSEKRISVPEKYSAIRSSSFTEGLTRAVLMYPSIIGDEGEKMQFACQHWISIPNSYYEDLSAYASHSFTYTKHLPKYLLNFNINCSLCLLLSKTHYPTHSLKGRSPFWAFCRIGLIELQQWPLFAKEVTLTNHFYLSFINYLD